MKIAQVALHAESVRPRLYGGSERVDATVYHGLPPDVCPLNLLPCGSDFTFLGE
jgi:hypothetical protein